MLKPNVFLPDVLVCRRVDVVAVIGRALVAAAQGTGWHRVAVLVERPFSTVRGWLRRARAAGPWLAAHFLAWAYRLDPGLGPVPPGGGALANAVHAIGVAARAASLRLGPRPASRKDATAQSHDEQSSEDVAVAHGHVESTHRGTQDQAESGGPVGGPAPGQGLLARPGPSGWERRRTRAHTVGLSVR